MQDKSKKKNVSNSNSPAIDRRVLLKSAVAVAGGYAAASIAEPDLWAGIPNSSSADSRAGLSENGFPSADLVAKIKSGRRIDVHQHVVLPEYEKALAKQGVVENSNLKTKVFTKESVLGVMAELGMDATVLLPFSTSGIYHGNDENARYLTQVTNEAAAQLVSEAPQKFGFYAILPLPDLQGALKEMETALDKYHAAGVSFLSTQNGVYIGDPAFDELYSEMNRRSAIGFIHPGRPPYTLNLKMETSLIEYTFETTRVACNLIYNGVMERYPNIKWILAHAGGTLPYVPMRLAAVQGEDKQHPSFLDRIPKGFLPYLKQFYYDTAIAGTLSTMSALVATADPSHIFYGSDWPYVPKPYIAEQVINLREMAPFAGRRLAAMERYNALALFKGLAAAHSA
jgi:predicted TIM-barrel fold metal-dependent hydrolase